MVFQAEPLTGQDHFDRFRCDLAVVAGYRESVRL